jgi:hypothetical protein
MGPYWGLLALRFDTGATETNKDGWRRKRESQDDEDLPELIMLIETLSEGE